MGGSITHPPAFNGAFKYNARQTQWHPRGRGDSTGCVCRLPALLGHIRGTRDTICRNSQPASQCTLSTRPTIALTGPDLLRDESIRTVPPVAGTPSYRDTNNTAPPPPPPPPPPSTTTALQPTDSLSPTLPRGRSDPTVAACRGRRVCAPPTRRAKATRVTAQVTHWRSITLCGVFVLL